MAAHLDVASMRPGETARLTTSLGVVTLTALGEGKFQVTLKGGSWTIPPEATGTIASDVIWVGAPLELSQTGELGSKLPPWVSHVIRQIEYPVQ